MKKRKTDSTVVQRGASPVASGAWLEALLSGLAKTVEGLYEAKRAANALGLHETEKEISDMINDVDKAWIETRRFMSSNTAVSRAAGDNQSP